MQFSLIETYKDFVENRQNKQLVIFGAGNIARSIISRYFAFDDIPFICDNNKNKWRNKFFGIPVCSPEVMRGEPDNYVVIIAVKGYFAVYSIRKQLNSMGVKHVYEHPILANMSVWLRYNSSGSNYFHELNTYKMITDAREKIGAVRSMLCDEKSVTVYDAFIEKLKYNIGNYADICDDLYNHYFDDELFDYGENEILIDGGDYSGIDAIQFSDMLGGRFKKAYVFEPDDNNFSSLCANIKEHMRTSGFSAGQFSLHKAGVYSASKNVGFMRSGNGASSITEGGALGHAIVSEFKEPTDGIAVVRLDDVIPPEDRVTFIKLDIEGAEVEALNGAERIIKENRPKMAICIYHRIEDIWEIPLLLKAMVPEYKLYVRHHGEHPYEKVLYAKV